jgi:hypothetical protein
MAKKKAKSASVTRKKAFQCDTCKAVFPAEIAGDNDVPLACPHCRAGLMFRPDGTKEFHPENWIKLADLSAAELGKGFHVHGLKPTDVAKHTGHKARVTPTGIVHGKEPIIGTAHTREAVESLGSHDKA